MSGVPATAPNSNLGFIRDRLNEIRTFPCISSTHVALNLPRLLGGYQTSASQSLAATDRVEPLTTECSAKTMVRAAGMSVITFIALEALSVLSLMVNGAVGAGKIALSFAVTLTDYKAAQNLLEEGTFHLLVAASDFAIAYFSLARAALALASGMAPDTTNRTVEMVYKPWSGAILHADGATPETMNLDRKNYSYLQRLADAVQCIVMPNDGEGRFGSAWAAIQGVR